MMMAVFWFHKDKDKKKENEVAGIAHLLKVANGG